MCSILPTKIKLKTLENNDIFLEELLVKEKVNLLLFYNTDCLGCTGRAIPFAYKISESNKEKLNLIVIHVDFAFKKHDKDEILDIFYSKKSPFSIYKDENASLYKVLGCEGTPHWIVLSKEGEVKKSIFGSQQNAQNRLHYYLDEVFPFLK